MDRCDRLPLVGAFYDEELPPAAREDMASHVMSCPLCQRELAELRRLSGRLAIVAPELPAGLVERLGARLRAGPDREILRTGYALLAIAASLLVVFSLWVQRLDGGGAEQPVASGWESAAVGGSTDAAPSHEVATAEWIVQGLSGKDGDE